MPAYIPPTMRTKTTTNIAKKTALKKEFAIDQQAFPTLGDTIKKTATRGTPISFSSAAAKPIDQPTEKVVDVLPGWVHIRRKDGKYQYKYGKMSDFDAEAADRWEDIQSKIILKNRIAREQYDRDWDIERLGDLSEFYGEPPLAELYVADEINEDGMSEDSGNSSGVDDF
jgi:hypothetical protein